MSRIGDIWASSERLSLCLLPAALRIGACLLCFHKSNAPAGQTVACDGDTGHPLLTTSSLPARQLHVLLGRKHKFWAIFVPHGLSY